MAKRLASLLLAGVSAATLALSGCGRAVPIAGGTGQPAMTALDEATSTGSLSTLLKLVSARVRQAYPHAQVYEVGGTEVTSTDGYDSWRFGAADDVNNPQNTVVVEYHNGAFSTPRRHTGLDFGRALDTLKPHVNLSDAIADLRKAGFKQGFNFVDLFRPLNPTYNEAYYVFTSRSAIVSVGAEDGAVCEHRSKDWYTKPAGESL
ncbi:MAG TPA: hypothetical protein V6D47_08675 [Oscillatoriaceae cyanobacterium]